MIDKARDKILGEYFLNFFVIKCNTTIDFENIEKSDTFEQLGSFFHEYIHFLQNASTTYGNMNMAYYYAKTLNILSKINSSSNIEVNRIIPDNEGIEFAGDICNITLGDAEQWTYNNYDFIEIIDTEFKRDEILGKEYDDAVVPILHLRLFCREKKETKEFNFGAMAIMESMASQLERHFYKIKFKGRQLQYDICMLLWNYFAPQYSDREDLVVATCECSLMYENPGSMFYNVVKHIIRKEEKNLNIADIVNIFWSNIRPNFEKTYRENFIEMNRLFCELVSARDNFSITLNIYVSEFCNKLFTLRKSNNHFLSDLMIMPPDKAKKKIIDIMTETNAVPLIITKNNEVYSGYGQDNKMNMINYLALYSFNRLFGVSGKNECYMVEICKNSGYSIVNDKCLYCPWDKANEEKLCPMGQIWYMWGIQGKKLVD